MNSIEYLRQLSVSPEAFSSCDIDTLARLQRRHVQSVPFTNLHVRRGDGANLVPDRTVPRILSSGGGLCYDLNSGFAWLLAELGYDVTFLSGRVRRDDGTFGPAYDHLALLVDDHLVDVGFGDFARQPLPLDGDSRTDVSGAYRVDARNDHYAAQKRTDDCWRDEYRFSAAARTLDEFGEMATYHTTSPESPFTGDLLATRATETGRITLSGTTFTSTRDDDQRKQRVRPEQRHELLREAFGLAETWL